MKKIMILIAVLIGFFSIEAAIFAEAKAESLPPAKKHVILKEKEKIRQDKRKKKAVKQQFKQGKITKAQAKARVNNINRHIETHKGKIRSVKHSTK